MIRFLTAGESHGKALTTIVEGFPSNLIIKEDYINFHLKRRQMGYGRGARMKIEADTAEILSGVRFEKTLGSPISPAGCRQCTAYQPLPAEDSHGHLCQSSPS